MNMKTITPKTVQDFELLAIGIALLNKHGPRVAIPLPEYFRFECLLFSRVGSAFSRWIAEVLADPESVEELKRRILARY